MRSTDETQMGAEMAGRAIPSSGALLWFRALLLCLVSLAAGTLAHVSAAGMLPGPGPMLALVAIGTACAAPLLRTEASPSRVMLLLVLGQTAAHIALTAMSGHRGDLAPAPGPAAAPLPVSPSAGPRVGSLYDQVMQSRPTGTSAQLSVPEWALHLAGVLTGQHLHMTIAHVAAAALAGAWLASGERALWCVVLLAGRVIASRPGIPTPLIARRPASGTHLDPASVPPPSQSLSPRVRLRGPPLVTA